MVLGKLPVPGRPTVWMIVEQGPIMLAVGAGGVFFFFGHLYSPLSFLFSFSLSLGVVVVVVALLFYVHGKHLRSCRDGQLS